MTIVRGPRPDSGFTILDNDILRDPRLSYRARGILAAILSRPDDWRTDAKSLARDAKEGRDAILTALRELVDAGYIVREKKRDPETGRIRTTQVVFDRPRMVATKRTEVGLPELGKPELGKPDSLRSNDTKNPLTPTKGKACSKHRRRKDYCSDCDKANTPKPVVPRWCGECDESGKDDPLSRWIEFIDDEGTLRAAKCPRCYPKAVAS